MTVPTRDQLDALLIVGLCPTHAAESAQWLDYRLVPSVRIANSAAYDDTVAGMSDRRHGRFEDWRRVVQSQRGLIRDACALECVARRAPAVAHERKAAA